MIVVPGSRHVHPTGGILARKDLEAIAAILQKHPQVWVYADEIYSRLVFDGDFFSIAPRTAEPRRFACSLMT